MFAKGTITGIAYNVLTRRSQMTIDSSFKPEELQELLKKDLKIELSQWSEKRTLNANAYYWKLVGLIAEYMAISTAEVHNRMLRDYGAVEYIGDMPVEVEVPDTEKSEREMLENMEVHLLPTDETRFHPDGWYRVCMLLKGSKRYDQKEMARLIDGITGECHELGIPTMTPDETERIKALWNQSS